MADHDKIDIKDVTDKGVTGTFNPNTFKASDDRSAAPPLEMRVLVRWQRGVSWKNSLPTHEDK